jgi:hypothetical protein
VALGSGNPGDTFAIVNGAPISVPWAFTDKSGANSPASGEFLEEGADLTALGLQGGFASFLARLGSSQGANHSDFVIGSFPLLPATPTPSQGVFAAGTSLPNTGVPSTLTVSNHLDGGPGSPGYQIGAAQSSDMSVLDKNLSGQTIRVTDGELFIDKNQEIQSLDASEVAICGVFSFDGNWDFTWASR